MSTRRLATVLLGCRFWRFRFDYLKPNHEETMKVNQVQINRFDRGAAQERSRSHTNQFIDTQLTRNSWKSRLAVSACGSALDKGPHLHSLYVHDVQASTQVVSLQNDIHTTSHLKTYAKQVDKSFAGANENTPRRLRFQHADLSRFTAIATRRLPSPLSTSHGGPHTPVRPPRL